LLFIIIKKVRREREKKNISLKIEVKNGENESYFFLLRLFDRGFSWQV
jgi:hypothetical protein